MRQSFFVVVKVGCFKIFSQQTKTLHWSYRILKTCYRAKSACRCQLPLDNVILGSGWMLRKINHWIDWWQYHHSPPWSSPSLCLSRTVLVVLPKDNWSSITSSNSWWNCISFFSSPNLQNHVTPVSKYSDAATYVKGGIGAASSISTSPPFQSSSRHRWRKKSSNVWRKIIFLFNER